MRVDGKERFQNLRLSKRLLLSFGIVLFLAAVLMAFAIYFVARVGSFSRLMYDGPYNSTTAVESIRADLNEAGIAIRNGMMEKDMDKYIAAINTARGRAKEELSALDNHFQGEPQLLVELNQSIDSLNVQRDKVLEAAKKGDYNNSYQLLLTDYRDSFVTAMSKADAVYAAADKSAKSYYNRAVTVTTVAIIFLSIVFLGMLGFGILLSIYTTKSVVRPMLELKNVAEQMAKGNLKAEINYVSRDEMGSLANSMRQMVKTLDSYITDISWGMKELSKGNLDIVPNVEFHGDFTVLMQNILSTVASFDDAITKIRDSSEQVTIGSKHIANSELILSKSAF